MWDRQAFILQWGCTNRKHKQLNVIFKIWFILYDQFVKTMIIIHKSDHRIWVYYYCICHIKKIKLTRSSATATEMESAGLYFAWFLHRISYLRFWFRKAERFEPQLRNGLRNVYVFGRLSIPKRSGFVGEVFTLFETDHLYVITTRTPLEMFFPSIICSLPVADTRTTGETRHFVTTTSVEKKTFRKSILVSYHLF